MNVDTSSHEIYGARQHVQDLPPGQRRGAPGAERAILDRTRHIVLAAREAARATLHWLAALPYDSRERLHSKEAELARLGLSWASDPVHDAALAHETAVARQRRLASDVALGDVARARPGPSAPTALADHRGSMAGSGPACADVAVVV